MEERNGNGSGGWAKEKNKNKNNVSRLGFGLMMDVKMRKENEMKQL